MSANPDFHANPERTDAATGTSVGGSPGAGPRAGSPRPTARLLAGASSQGHAGHTGHTVLLQLPGTPESLPAIRAAVVEAASECGFSEEEVAKVEMAVGEACTNIIEHAYKTRPLKLEIEVSICVLPDRLEVTIQDYSTIDFPIDHSPGMTIDKYIETGRKRGLGLFIIRSFVDDIEHRFIYGQGNELKLTKYFA